MKTKLEMAHEWALKNMFKDEYSNMTPGEFTKKSFEYADAMQAEADKRLTDATQKEEWQPDWSQAPEWANWWAMDGDKKTRWIYSELEQPYTSDNYLMWFAVGGFDSEEAPSFNYTGDWRESLRKRPN